jgi:DNA-binding NtrC family response regulator
MSSILIIEDEHALAAAISAIARRIGAEPSVAASGRGGLDKLAKRAPDLIVLDIGLPDMSGLEVLKSARVSHPAIPVIIITAHGTLENALEAQRLGAVEYFLKPLDLTEFQQALRGFLKEQGEAPVAKAAAEKRTSNLMIGAARTMQSAYAVMAQACGTDAPVLITGPAGAGKSLAARVIHSNSLRAPGAFVSFRPDEHEAEELEEVLLGKGGAWCGAAGGTLFIEEIVKLPLPVQGALEKRLNSSEQRAPRIIAATAQDLLASVREGGFRDDLYYRLKIVEVILPPLCERPEDIPALAAFFLSHSAGRTHQITLSEAAQAVLKAHVWPGNVRELRHAMQHAAAVCGGPVILPRHLPQTLSVPAGSQTLTRGHLDEALQESLNRWLDQKLTAAGKEMPAYDDVADELEALLLKLLLPRFDNKPTRLAAAMKMNRATLRRKCRDIM